MALLAQTIAHIKMCSILSWCPIFSSNKELTSVTVNGSHDKDLKFVIDNKY